jgi:hypothetical protein
MLRALGVDIVALREELDAATSDVEIFRYLKDSDRIFVSEDRKQLTRICEASELKAAGINAMYFAPFWNRLGFWKQAAWLVTRWPTIEGVQKGIARGGVVFELTQRGKLLPIALK